MAAFYEFGIPRTNTTDASFRRWVTFVHNAMVDGGWVNTADTGQVDLTTATKPALASTKAGYKIYRMNDALQGTKPIYVRFDFGSSSSGATVPAIWQIIGSGSNGTGTITGVIFDTMNPGGLIATGGGLDFTPNAVTRSSTATTDEDTHSMASVGPGHCAFAILINATVGLTFGIERGRNESGTVDGTRICFISNTGFTNLQRMTCGTHGTSAENHTENNTIPYSRPAFTQVAEDGRVGIGYIFPVDGLRKLRAPLRNFIVVSSTAMASRGFLDLRWGSETMRYRHLGNVDVENIFASVDTSSRILMRFD